MPLGDPLGPPFRVQSAAIRSAAGSFRGESCDAALQSGRLHVGARRTDASPVAGTKQNLTSLRRIIESRSLAPSRHFANLIAEVVI